MERNWEKVRLKTGNDMPSEGEVTFKVETQWLWVKEEEMLG